LISGVPIRYRAATKKDRRQWVALRHELWPDCPEARHRLEVTELLKQDGVVLVAEETGTLVGFAEVSIRHEHVEGTRAAPVPYLEGWYVRRSHRGKGIGRALLKAAERWAVARGFEEMASDTEIENKPSVRLHAKAGFSEVGRTVHFVKRFRKGAGGEARKARAG
jgi:aminoglycoside 6'-N-acetyltransferase I